MFYMIVIAEFNWKHVYTTWLVTIIHEKHFLRPRHLDPFKLTKVCWLWTYAYFVKVPCDCARQGMTLKLPQNIRYIYWFAIQWVLFFIWYCFQKCFTTNIATVSPDPDPKSMDQCWITLPTYNLTKAIFLSESRHGLTFFVIIPFISLWSKDINWSVEL
jgi:hypothetical protein